MIKKQEMSNLQRSFMDTDIAERMGKSLIEALCLTPSTRRPSTWMTELGETTAGGVARIVACIIKDYQIEK
jgi:hypothetical protein